MRHIMCTVMIIILRALLSMAKKNKGATNMFLAILQMADTPDLNRVHYRRV